MEALRDRRGLVLVILGIIVAVVFVLSFAVGKYPISPRELILGLVAPYMEGVDVGPEVVTIIYNVRLPRVIGALLIGGALACAGAAYQGIFRNPMASPDVLGASAGAGFGAALGILCGFSYFGVSISSFFFGIITLIVVYIISVKVNNKVIGIILAGIMVGSLFSSATSFLKLIADPDNTLPAITYWLMGSLSSVSMEDIGFVILPMVIGLAPIIFLRWKLNILTLSEQEARSIGVNTKIVRMVVITGATLITAASVSISGLIGWVGLVMPHIARMIVGQDYRYMIPASILLGGGFLLIVDNFARTISTAEVPIGILTAFIGAPFFLYLIIREGKKYD
ncbi:MAG: iron ABC transporter permease [Clostridium sp.]|uniref:FecCD family ABC transporter permease n=1 Tax=Clostridium sp. TaxID=1506 RepID=UPI002FC5922E